MFIAYVFCQGTQAKAPSISKKISCLKKNDNFGTVLQSSKLPNSRPGIHHATFCQAPMFASDKQTLSVLRLHTEDNFYSEALILCAGLSRLVSGSDVSSSFISSWLLPSSPWHLWVPSSQQP